MAGFAVGAFANIMSERVLDWMTEAVVSVSSDTSLDDAAALMDEHGIRRLAVVDDKELTGILSLGDVRAAKAGVAAELNKCPERLTVGDLMTPDPISIPYNASLSLAAQTMLQVKVSGLPVVDEDGALCGLLSESDLFRYIVKNTD
jgi:acetoin utilization protein AcuB